MSEENNGWDEVKALERELLTSACRTNSKRVGELLDDSFKEIGASGNLWDKKITLQSLASEETFTFQIDFLETRTMSSDVVLLFYALEVTDQGHHNHHSLRTSIWKKTDVWRMVWHQGTTARK